MSERGKNKAARDFQRSLEEGYLLGRIAPRDRNELFRRACMVAVRGEPLEDSGMYIANEYADLARLANRIYRAGQKAGPK